MTAWEILIIDDSARFPLHVWRYLTGCLGFGIGEVGVDGSWVGSADGEDKKWISEEPLFSEDGRFRIWWVCADEKTREKLPWVFSRFDKQSSVYALVDVHGKRGTSYCAKEICGWLEQAQEGRVGEYHICPVSAYHVGEKEFPVLPKSRETLRRLIQDLNPRMESPQSPESVKHILVTGAGFEIRSDRGGFGMPSTREILTQMDSGMVPPDSSEAGKNAFPVPSQGIWDDSGDLQTLKKFALTKNLDTYWDYLLEQELRHRLGNMLAFETPEGRDANKAKALWRERALREAFRRSLLRHDWGYMNQSLDAAQLPLHAWLTTNYTQFADRAISLYGDLKDHKLGIWRIISTAAEARTVTRDGVGTPEQKARYLFKLHGDIAHLQTMAIAGHDKERFSPLSMPVEDLYEIYAAAERYLIDSLGATTPSLAVWHIVGHGLQDRRLCSLLAWVSSHLSEETAQLFAVVNLQPEDLRDVLAKSLGKKRPGALRALYPCKLTAAEYMARLSQFLRGTPPELPEGRQHEVMLDRLKAAVEGPPTSSQGLF